VRLWVDDQLLIDGSAPHDLAEDSGMITLIAGHRYAIRVEYYELSGDAQLQLFWSSASQPREIVPQSQLYPPEPPHGAESTGTGLLGRYYDDLSFTSLRRTRLDSDIDFDWSDGAPDPALTGPYAARWIGQIEPRYSETYTFISSVVLSDQADRLNVRSQTDTVTINGRTTTTIYDAAVHTITTIDPSGLRTVTTLDASGRPARLETNNLAPVQYSYDAQGRLIAVTEGSGANARTTSTSYDPSGFPSSTTDALNRTTSYTYDPLGRLLAEILPNGQELTFSYDAAGNRISGTDMRGVHESYEYDLQNRLIVRTRDPDGQALRTEFVYDAADNLIDQIDDAGPGRSNATTHYTYTPIDGGVQYAVSTKTDALGNQTSYTYTSAGDLQSVTDALGQTTWLHTTPQGWRDALITPSGRTTTTIYTNDGQPLSVTDAAGNRRSFTYDALGRMLSATDGTLVAANQTLTYSYDANSRVAATTIGAASPLSQTMLTRYDSFGQVISTTVALGTPLERTDLTHYNADATVAETIQNYRDGSFDPARPDEDVVTTYGYDTLGRRIWIRDTLGHYSVTHYAENGRVDWVARNQVPFELDSQGQPAFHAFDPARPDANSATLFGYDSLGRTVLVTETGLLAGYQYLAPHLLGRAGDCNRRRSRGRPDRRGHGAGAGRAGRCRLLGQRWGRSVRRHGGWLQQHDRRQRACAPPARRRAAGGDGERRWPGRAVWRAGRRAAVVARGAGSRAADQSAAGGICGAAFSSRETDCGPLDYCKACRLTGICGYLREYRQNRGP
jgi:YD repeat-containing protein